MSAAPRSAALFERARRVTPGGVHSPVRAFRGVGGTPRFVRAAQGARLEDEDGRRYIDYCMSWGPLIFGHQDPQVRAAVDEVLGRGWSYGAAEAGSLALAEFIVERLPWIEQVRFVNSGTEAVMSALRLARAATGRPKILKFAGCYHGHVDALLVKAGSGLAEMASPDSAGIPAHVAADTLVAPLDDPAAIEAIFSAHGTEIAAVIIEPLPANNGLLPQQPELFRTLVTQTRRAGALLIFDEVISGFRIGLRGMAGELGIAPDLCTYGKVIGGGFPVGAYGGRAELMQLIAPAGPVYQAGTLSANPVTMAAGLATLRRLDAEPPYALLEQRAQALKTRLQSLAQAAGVEGFRMQTRGSLFWPVLGEVPSAGGLVRAVEQIPATQGERFARLFHALLERGVYLAPSGFEVGFLSTAHTDEDLELTAAAFGAVWAEQRS